MFQQEGGNLLRFSGLFGKSHSRIINTGCLKKCWDKWNKSRYTLPQTSELKKTKYSLFFFFGSVWNCKCYEISRFTHSQRSFEISQRRANSAFLEEVCTAAFNVFFILQLREDHWSFQLQVITAFLNGVLAGRLSQA